MNVRRALPEDFPSLAMLLQSALPRIPYYFDAAISSGMCLVAETNAAIVGCGVLTYDFFDRGFIRLLFIKESDRRRGVGSLLLFALEAKCATPILFTSTNQSNFPMQKLLLRSGYIPSGAVDGLDPGDPELFFRKNLHRE